MINVSEGRRGDVISALAAAAGDALLDVHADRHHHRAVLTMVGEESPRAVTIRAVELIDLRRHSGAHPRHGAVDVVPFSPLGPEGIAPLGAMGMAEALGARDRFVVWAADRLGVPTFAYGPERTLPDVRRHAFRSLPPTAGPLLPHPTAGAIAVGARPVLVAYNVWLATGDVAEARRAARAVRSPAVRALGLRVGTRAQVSMNLLDPTSVGPGDVYDAVAAMVATAGTELVGLVPATVLDAVPERRWSELDLSAERTIEHRLATRGASR